MPFIGRDKYDYLSSYTLSVSFEMHAVACSGLVPLNPKIATQEHFVAKAKNMLKILTNTDGKWCVWRNSSP